VATERKRPVISDGLPSQLPDIDPEETNEWVESLDGVIDERGAKRARYVMLRLLERARERQVGVPPLTSTDYINTIPPEQEPWFPGDEFVERRIRAYIRWNAAMLVHRAQRPEIGVGGHISTYASSASLYEVGMNHFFRGKDHPGGGDHIFFQGHASPGMYARAFLEGRLSENDLDGFRQELSHPGGGLPSYPHPRLMPNFWEFPTVSMGLGPLNAIYQARYNRYLHNRGIKDTSQQHVWAFLGDGEMDEVESLGAIGLAAREELDNLTFVINCNLQRLDGPVRGNGKVIQELESFFRGAGWNVIKVIWGREWDPLLAADTDGALVNLMNVTPDGDYQTYKGESGAYVRENFFGRDPRTRKLVEGMSDDEVWNLKRGGHDYRKLYAAYKAATEHTGQPTVILAKTIKGWTLGSHFEARNATHQMKKLTLDDLKGFRDRLYLEISAKHKSLAIPDSKAFGDVKRGSGKQKVATTMAFVRLLKDLMKDKEFGPRWVPIIPDEARTFGLDSLFPTKKIYSPHGQTYTSVDRELFLSYKEATNGQILHEGINEAGSTASFIAAGTSYATHDEPMIPLYIFYSMFGFQRTADELWAASDQMARGFLLGATAGRTTLNGEGLQHEDGHSLLIAATNPAVVSYDPAFAFEIAHIVENGLHRMYGEKQENVFYYLTIYNEPILQPAEPEGVDVEGLLKGLYRYKAAPATTGPKAQILASGTGMQWALKAQELLAQDWGVAADVWSATSWTELRRDAVEVEEHNLLNPGDQPRKPYIQQKLEGTEGPVVAVSDFMRAVPDLISRWVPNDYTSLGTDGFGMSDTRHALRRHFHVDGESVAVATLRQLALRGKVPAHVPAEAAKKYAIDDVNAAPVGETGGDS
jgi:pyruvate dehydrogenase E1 component